MEWESQLRDSTPPSDTSKPPSDTSKPILHLYDEDAKDIESTCFGEQITILTRYTEVTLITNISGFCRNLESNPKVVIFSAGETLTGAEDSVKHAILLYASQGGHVILLPKLFDEFVSDVEDLFKHFCLHFILDHHNQRGLPTSLNTNCPTLGLGTGLSLPSQIPLNDRGVLGLFYVSPESAWYYAQQPSTPMSMILQANRPQLCPIAFVHFEDGGFGLFCRVDPSRKEIATVVLAMCRVRNL